MKLRITVEGKAYEVDVEFLDEGPAHLPHSPSPSSPPPSPALTAPSPVGASDGQVHSPLAGQVIDVLVKPGDAVKMNQALLVLEAMKMESNVASPVAGVVKEVLVKRGDAVSANQVLVRF